MKPNGKECPPAVAPAGEASIAVGANAPLSYTPTRAAGKADAEGSGSRAVPNFRTPKKRGGYGDGALPHLKGQRIAFRASTGRVSAYTGKRGRVLHMLATMGEGVTQWDTLPWHTRLGASVHVLRCDGLEIDTALEGEYRHARYTLRTAGCLIIQAENSGTLRAREGNAQ